MRVAFRQRAQHDDSHSHATVVFYLDVVRCAVRLLFSPRLSLGLYREFAGVLPLVTYFWGTMESTHNNLPSSQPYELRPYEPARHSRKEAFHKNEQRFPASPKLDRSSRVVLVQAKRLL